MKYAMLIAGLFLLSLAASAGKFIETFDDEHLDDWRELNSPDAAPGTAEVLDGELQITNPDGGVRMLITGDETWQDYVIECDVMPLKKLGPGNIGIVARVREPWVVWCAITDLILGDPEPKVLCSVSNIHAIKGLRGIGIGGLARPHPLLRLNRWATLKLSVQGNTVTFWINGKEVLQPTVILHPEAARVVLEENQIELPAFRTGGAGFGLANYTARFNNITITGEGIPNKGGLSVSPRANIATTWGSLKRF